jgi:hypothetical protein
MGRGKVFQCELTVSSGVEEKLLSKHNIEMWEIEEAVYDDPSAFSITYRECHFIYGRTFAGRYLLVLGRILSSEEVRQFGLEEKTNVFKVITSRDMNRNQGDTYNKRRKAQ